MNSQQIAQGNARRTIAAIMRADLLQRTRGYGFLITLALTIYLTYVYLPPATAGYVTLSIGGRRGVYDSAWIGSVVAVMSVIFLPLAGFYLVKNAIERDRRTGVGQIIATTPLRKWQYTLGKALSNFVFLAVMAGVALLAGVVLQLWRGEDMAIRPAGYLLPYLLITLPMLAFMGSLAVLFESTGALRGGFGNILFILLFFAWITAMIALDTRSQGLLNPTGTGTLSRLEPTGAFIVLGRMGTALGAQEPGVREGLALGAVSTSYYGGLRTAAWPGIAWTMPLVLGRLLWFGIALLLGAGSALFFDRFQVAREPRRRASAGPHAVPGALGASGEGTAEAPVLDLPRRAPSSVSLTPLDRRSRAGWAARGLRIFIHELRLALSPMPWWWYAGALALLFVSGVAAPELARRIWLPLAWLWPVLVWSPLGNREAQAGTAPVVFATAHPVRRLLLASWAAGALVALAMAAGAGARLVVEGQPAAVLPLLPGAAFVPALALALGAWTGSSRAFEALYAILWYAGPMSGVPVLDFMGVSTSAGAAPAPIYFAVAAAVLLGIAYLGRRRQMLA